MRTAQSSLPELPKWTRRYAENRTLPLLLRLVLFAALFAGIGGFSYLAGQAYRGGSRILFVVFLVAAVAAVAANTWLSVGRWGGRWLASAGRSLYGREGRVELRVEFPARAARAVTRAFGLCVAASVAAGLAGLVPARHMQPLTALYVVPFAAFMTLARRRRGSYLLLLWPFLYLLHAILLLAGAPILFLGRWEALNMLLPVFGYGTAVALLAHLYSRYALFRLRRIARLGLPQSHGLA